jgi:hypothetical protein
MISTLIILAFSVALFFFYVQTFCESVLRHEFSHPYLQDIIARARLEYPRLRDAFASSASSDYSDARLALECDFATLAYLLKNSRDKRGHWSRREKILLLYFRFLLLWLSVRHALKLQEKDVVRRLTTVLDYFANLLGERLSAVSAGNALSHLES